MKLDFYSDTCRSQGPAQFTWLTNTAKVRSIKFYKFWQVFRTIKISLDPRRISYILIHFFLWDLWLIESPIFGQFEKSKVDVFGTRVAVRKLLFFAQVGFLSWTRSKLTHGQVSSKKVAAFKTYAFLKVRNFTQKQSKITKTQISAQLVPRKIGHGIKVIKIPEAVLTARRLNRSIAHGILLFMLWWFEERCSTRRYERFSSNHYSVKNNIPWDRGVRWLKNAPAAFAYNFAFLYAKAAGSSDFEISQVSIAASFFNKTFKCANSDRVQLRNPTWAQNNTYLDTNSSSENVNFRFLKMAKNRTFNQS